jgi:hypothetical protein
MFPVGQVVQGVSMCGFISCYWGVLLNLGLLLFNGHLFIGLFMILTILLQVCRQIRIGTLGTLLLGPKVPLYFVCLCFLWLFGGHDFSLLSSAAHCYQTGAQRQCVAQEKHCQVAGAC